MFTGRKPLRFRAEPNTLFAVIQPGTIKQGFPVCGALNFVLGSCPREEKKKRSLGQIAVESPPSLSGCEENVAREERCYCTETGPLVH